MKRVIYKLIEAVVYYIIMHILIAIMITERYRLPLYKISAWGICSVTLFTMIELLLGGDEAPFTNLFHKFTVLIFVIYAICFTGVMALDSFGELLLRIVGG